MRMREKVEVFELGGSQSGVQLFLQNQNYQQFLISSFIVKNKQIKALISNKTMQTEMGSTRSLPLYEWRQMHFRT